MLMADEDEELLDEEEEASPGYSKRQTRLPTGRSLKRASGKKKAMSAAGCYNGDSSSLSRLTQLVNTLPVMLQRFFVESFAIPDRQEHGIELTQLSYIVGREVGEVDAVRRLRLEGSGRARCVGCRWLCR